MASRERLLTVLLALLGGGGLISMVNYVRPVAPLCTPGLPQACRCANNAMGEARCAADGSGFGECLRCGDPEIPKGDSHRLPISTGGVSGAIPAGGIAPNNAGRRHEPAPSCDTPAECNRLGIELSKRGADSHLIADYAAAAAALHSACERDYLPACLNEAGVLVAPSDTMCSLADYPRARRLFERACTANMSRGCVELAKMSWKGQGEPPDLEQALRYADQGCNAGVKEGCEVREALHSKEIELRDGKPFFQGHPVRPCRAD